MKPGSLANRILNVGKNEWPRIALAWTLNLCLRAGFVIGWTATIAMFINRIGIERLPYLFVLNALLIMLGTIVFSYLLKKISHGLLIFYTTLMAIALLLLATLFSYTSDLAFFGILLLAQSVFISQLNILITLFTEDLFSPLESQRTFPLIATSETIGGIIGGLTVGILAGVLPAYKFMYLWILAISLIIPVLLTSHSYGKKTPCIKIAKHERTKKPHQQAIPNLLKGIKRIRRVPFLQGIILIVMFQFMLLYLFEFQYTKAIQEEVIAHNPPPIAFELHDYQPDTSLQVSLLNASPVAASTQAEHEMNLENALSQKLGMLQMIFSAGSLVVQLFLTSRILSSLGIVSSLLIHPIITVLSLIGMVFNFNFLSASIGRSSFEITSGIFKNAYHSSYYAIRESLRDQTKELMEGFVKPFGAILAFILLLTIQSLYTPESESTIITSVMVVIAGFMFIRVYRLHQDYTNLSYRHLGADNDLPTRLNAIEILGQKGHEIKNEQFIKFLQNKREKIEIKRHILETLRLREDPDIIPDILESLQDAHRTVRLTALETLQEFKDLNKFLENRNFTRHHAIEVVKKLFRNEESSQIREACIHLLAKFDDHELIPFLIEILESGDEKLQRACIRACGTFKDQSIIHYIKNYLDHKRPLVRAEAIVALWQFKKIRKTLRHYLDQMQSSRKRGAILGSVYALGKIGTKKDVSYVIKYLASNDQEIRKKAAFAIAELDHPAAIPHIVEFIMHDEKETTLKTKKLIRGLSNHIVENIEQLVHLRISEYINDILKETGASTLAELNIETLEKLKTAYATVDEHHEVFKIEALIKTKQKKPSDLIHSHETNT